MDRDVKAYRGENIIVSTRVLPTFSIRPDLSKTQLLPMDALVELLTLIADR